MPAIPFEVRKQMVLAEVKARGSEAVKIFRQAFKKPDDLEFAAMCAMRTPAGARYTDRAMDETIHNRMGKNSPIVLKEMFRAAKRAGVNTAGKVHMASLGPVTDQDAWVTNTDDVRRVLKKKNLNSDPEGAIKHQGYMPDPPKRKGKYLAPDLVAETEIQYLARDKSLAEKVKRSKKARRELRERIVQTHGK